MLTPRARSTLVCVSASDWSWFESALDVCAQRAGTTFVGADHPVAEAAGTDPDPDLFGAAVEPGAALLDVSSLLATGGPLAVFDAITEDRIAELLAEITTEPTPLVPPANGATCARGPLRRTAS